MAAIATKLKPKAKADIAALPNGLVIEDRFVHDDAGREHADRINAAAADLFDTITELQDHRAELLAGVWEMPLRALIANGEEFQRDKAELLGRIREHLTRLQQVLPSLVPGCRRAVDEAEQAYGRCIDELEETFRASGIDESSLPGGEFAASNPEGARELFRKRLQSEPPALTRMGAWNKAKENLAVLQSMLPRKASTEWAATYLKFPAVASDLPHFVYKLFA